MKSNKVGIKFMPSYRCRYVS